MKRLKKYSIFLLVIVVSFVLLLFKNQFQVDYTEINLNKIEEKIKNKDSFVLTFTNVGASNEQTYASELIYMVDGVNQDVIKMNKFNKNYVSKNRVPIYYNTEIYSKTDEIKKIFNSLFKDVELMEINFDNIPVSVWIEKGKVIYAGIGQTNEKNHKLLTDSILKNNGEKIDVSKIKFSVTKKETTEEADKNKPENKEDTNDSKSDKTESKK